MDHVQLISIREFGKRCNCSDTAIHKAIKAGKISVDCLDYSNPKRPKINPAMALASWGRNYAPEYVQSSGISAAIEKSATPAAKIKPQAKKIKPTPVEDVEDDATDVEAEFNDPDAGTDENDLSDEHEKIRLSKRAPLAEAKRIDAIAIAKMNILKLQEARGEMLPQKKVYQEFFDVGVRIRSALQGTPDKHLDALRAIDDRSEAHAYLYAVMTEICEMLAMPETL